jgi:Ni/Fe-hydrogenase 1 B-type cytochrome subunit
MATKYLHIPRLRRIYVWELPVRIYHWLNVVVLMVLIATGFYIANPLALMSQTEATNVFTMGWVRFIHFAAAYIFSSSTSFSGYTGVLWAINMRTGNSLFLHPSAFLVKCGP